MAKNTLLFLGQDWKVGKGLIVRTNHQFTCQPNESMLDKMHYTLTQSKSTLILSIHQRCKNGLWLGVYSPFHLSEAKYEIQWNTFFTKLPRNWLPPPTPTPKKSICLLLFILLLIYHSSHNWLLLLCGSESRREKERLRAILSFFLFFFLLEPAPFVRWHRDRLLCLSKMLKTETSK